MKSRFFLTATAICALALVSCSSGKPLEAEPSGILINGVRWAGANVAEPGRFAASFADSGMFYQWGRRTGWNSTDLPALVSSPEGQIWSDAEVSGDSWPAAATPCPEGWRLPTQSDFFKLLDPDKVSYRWSGEEPGGGIDIPGWGTGSRAVGGAVLLFRGYSDTRAEDGNEDCSGVEGMIFTDRSTGRQLFLPAAGVRYRDDGRLMNVGTDGFYWSLWEGSEFPDGVNPDTGAFFFEFFRDSEDLPPGYFYSPVNDTRLEGYSVRCVLKE